jgi:hypothetical protein
VRASCAIVWPRLNFKAPAATLWGVVKYLACQKKCQKILRRFNFILNWYSNFALRALRKVIVLSHPVKSCSLHLYFVWLSVSSGNFPLKKTWRKLLISTCTRGIFVISKCFWWIFVISKCSWWSFVISKWSWWVVVISHSSCRLTGKSVNNVSFSSCLVWLKHHLQQASTLAVVRWSETTWFWQGPPNFKTTGPPDHLNFLVDARLIGDLVKTCYIILFKIMCPMYMYMVH